MTEIDLGSFGGKGDGSADNSAAFEAALGVLKQGGGTLHVGAGVWKTGPIELYSGVTLALDDGAVIAFSPTDAERRAPVMTRVGGVEQPGPRPLLFARDQTGVAITGTGRVDGGGAYWWKKFQETRCPRPPLVQFLRCARVTVEGVRLVNSPAWTLHPVYCEDVTIRGVGIENPRDAPNTDGIDIDSCAGVLIEDCFISVGDDAIVLKSGAGVDGVRVNRPTRGVTARRCRVENAHGGVVIGSETAGGVFDLTVEDCVFHGADRGIRVKTRRGRGGCVHDLRFSRLVMENTLCPLAINMYYRCGAELSDGFFGMDPQPVTPLTPSIKAIEVSGVRAVGCRASAGFVAGLPESPVEDLVVSDCVFRVDEDSGVSPDLSEMFLGLPPARARGFRVLNAKNPRFSNVRVEGPRDAFVYE